MAHRLHAMICTCTNCISNGALKIKNALEAEIARKDLVGDIRVVQTGASGLCVKGPILMVQPDGIFYQYLKEKDIRYTCINENYPPLIKIWGDSRKIAGDVFIDDKNIIPLVSWPIIYVIIKLKTWLR